MENFYRQLNRKVSSNQLLVNMLKHASVLTHLMAIIYIVMILNMFINPHINIDYLFIIKPAVTLLTVMMIRIIYNPKRPFEKYQFDPVIDHDKGHSFPSKHSASSLIIALMFYKYHFVLFLVLLLISLLIGLSRILSGIHYIRDVLGGYLLAMIIFII